MEKKDYMSHLSAMGGDLMQEISKTPDYTGLPANFESLIVQKSNPFQTLSESNFSLTEFKIIDAYLARIDSHDPSKRYVRFSRGELEQILGIKRILTDDLSHRLDNLFQVITLTDKEAPGGFVKLSLFERAQAVPDENGVWQVDLVCTESALKYIFNIESKGYLQYMLKNVVDIKSRYAYLMYLFLERNRFRSPFKISIEKLKKLIGCDDPTYDEYKHFNNLILKKCQEELHAKTTLRYTYQPTTRVNRKYSEIEFTVLPGDATAYIEEETQVVTGLPEASGAAKTDDSSESETANGKGQAETVIKKQSEADAVDYGSSLSNLLGDCACDNEFSPQQVRVLQDLVIKAVHSSSELDMCNYLMNKIHVMNVYSQKSEIKNRFMYLCAMVKNDISAEV